MNEETKLLAGTFLLLGWLFLTAQFLARRRFKRRGRELLSRPTLQSREKKELTEGIRFGGALLPLHSATSHFLVSGTTGSGKTLTIRELMKSALPAIKPGSGCRALIYDAKQDCMSSLHAMREVSCPVVTLHPFDKRCAAWDIAADVTAPATAWQIASILIPSENGSNRFFSDAARHILYGVMLSFIARANAAWTFSDLVVVLKSLDKIRLVLMQTGAGEELIQGYFEEERTLNNIFSTLQSRIAPFEPVAAAWARAAQKVSLRDWVNSEFILVLGNDESVRAALDSINQVIFKRVSELLLAKGESKTERSWLFLDEVREAGKLAGLPSLMTKGRSKGVCCVLGFQDIEGMREVYGEHIAHEICGMCSHKAFLRMESAKTAAWAAETIGEYEEVLRYESRSRSGLLHSSRTLSEQCVKRDVVMPGEFLTLPLTNPENGLSGYFVSPFLGAFLAQIPWSEIEKSFDPESDEADYLPRDEADQFLTPWENADYERLGIEFDEEEELEPKEEPGKLVFDNQQTENSIDTLRH